MNFIKSLSSVFLSGLILCSCNGEPQAPIAPDNLLTPAKFEQVLADYALAESAANMNIKNVGVTRIDTAYAFDPLKENEVRQSQYDSTILFYSQHPELYKKIYENVLTILSEMQSQRDSLTKAPVAE
jgi:hypothetical protein